jgi:SAM-dependent methyltransferase
VARIVNEYIEANRKHWDEIVPVHVSSPEYAVDAFKAGITKLKPVELEEVGDVTGKTLLHMQCHFGLDTLSWGREGAIVTGIDFSAPAIEAAQELADETNIDATFLVSNVYDLPENLEGEFDIVFTGYGALNWLPDMEAWAKVAAQFVKPGGTFYLVEFHPMSMIFDDDPKLTDLRVKYPYFPEFGPVEDDQDGTYVDLEAKFENKLTYHFPHPVGEVVSALIDAGLRIEFLHEFPFTPWKFLETMKQVDPYSWRLAENDGSVPLIYSIKATKPN